MSPLRTCGFFSDLPFGEAGEPNLRDSIDSPADEHTPKIVAYLRGAAQLTCTPAVLVDILDPGGQFIGPLRYLTDGEWVWRSDLPYYVERYHCRVPREFIEHMRSRDWLPPAKAELDLDALAAEWLGANDFARWPEGDPPAGGP